MKLAVCACVLVGTLIARFGTENLTFPFGPVAGASAGHSARTDRDEYDLKAAFLFNFVRYTKWPKDAFQGARSPIIVAIVGKDPFGKRLARTFGGKKIAGRPVLIRRYKCAEDIGRVHVLMLGALDRKERARCVNKVKGKPVLTIADTGGVKAKGTMIGFYLEGKRIKFEIAPSRVKGSRLKMRSQVFNSARIVRLKK